MDDLERNEMSDSASYPLKERTGPPPEVMAEILSMGKSFNEEIIEKVSRLYIPLHKKSDRSGIKLTGDLEYGPDDRHRLDIHIWCLSLGYL